MDDLAWDGSSGDPTVITYDTGGTTGWSLFSVHPDSLLLPDIMILDNVTHWACGQFVGSEFEQVDQMLDLADDWPGAALLCEDFVLRRFDASRAVLAPVRLNAAFRYSIARDRRVHLQNPQLALTAITDARLKAFGYWENTEGEVHARDAIRHALTFLKRLKTQPKLLKETFPALFE